MFSPFNDQTIKEKSGLGISVINKIKEALNQENINSIGALLGVKGVGKTSVEKSFNFTKQKSQFLKISHCFKLNKCANLTFYIKRNL